MNRWTGAIFLLPLAGVGLYALGVFGFDWRGSWVGSVDAVSGTTVLLGPLAAAFAAQVALGRVRLAEVTGCTPRAARVALRCWAHVWARASAVYVGLALLAIGLTLGVPHGGPVQVWSWLGGVLVLGLGSAFGVLMIGVWPHRVSVLVAGPLLFLAGSYGPGVALLRLGPVSGSMTGLEYRPDAFAQLAVALAATTAGVSW